MAVAGQAPAALAVAVEGPLVVDSAAKIATRRDVEQEMGLHVNPPSFQRWHLFTITRMSESLADVQIHRDRHRHHPASRQPTDRTAVSASTGNLRRLDVDAAP